jgi:alkyl hydroperoxide reductase subunit AhpF
VIVSTGATYRRLNIPSLEALHGAGVFYGAAVSEAQAMKEQEVYVVGAGNSVGLETPLFVLRTDRHLAVGLQGHDELFAQILLYVGHVLRRGVPHVA